MDNSRYSGWKGIFGPDGPALAAGPCSAESPSQLAATAEALKGSGVTLFRAGVWKPRTRPGSFEGAGEKALPWLCRAGRSAGMKVTTEVAGPVHVEKALAAGVDVLWIGARTTTNPFLVQDIADALRGSRVPVLVKNPMTADIGLWIGAMERLVAAGCPVVGAIHRGIPPQVPGAYRNSPQWNMAIDLRVKDPGLLILCDPSHMAGDRKYVRELSQKALDLDLDGLFLEVHVRPEEALSDAAQQLTPQALSEMLSSLVYPVPESSDSNYVQSIAQLRARIDEIDDELISLLAERMEICSQIGTWKRRNNVSVLQTSRWEEVMSLVLERSRSLGLDSDFVTSVFNLIHSESISRQ